MAKRISNLLSYTVIRIECIKGEGLSTGTGFFYGLTDASKRQILAIVTNAHVVAGASEARFVFSTTSDGKSPDIGGQFAVRVRNIQDLIFPHPDRTTDLVLIQTAPLIEPIHKAGKKPFFRAVTEDMVPSKENVESIGSIENILMVGYPNGLWDEKNNMPIIRKGITATPLNVDWQGLDQFVIDCACFPGSSGSPVFLHNDGIIRSDDGGSVSIGLGERVIFIGVLSSGPQISVSGKLEVNPIPTQSSPVPKINMMMNLGYCIKAGKLKEMTDALTRS